MVNYVVDILDPVSYKHLQTVRGFGTSDYDWHPLPKTDPRYQFLNLLDIIEGAEWYHGVVSSDEDAHVEEAYIENPYEVFELIRKLFA